MDINISRKLFNPAYLPYLDDQSRTQIFFGGASSGKSIFVVGQRVVYDLIKGDRNYLIIRNVADTSRKSTFKEVRKIIFDWKLDEYFNINKSDMVITCLVNGHQAMFAGLDNVEKLKSITADKGVITDIVVEEATETKEDDLRQLQKRLRGKSKVKKRMTLVFNPIAKVHWIHKIYFVGNFYDGETLYHKDNLLILKTTYKDNLRFLEKDDIDALENETNKYFREVYTLGNWGVFGDVIFTNWTVKDLSEMIPTFDNNRNGLDFGYASDPAAYNRMHFDKKRKTIYIYKEFHEKGLTNPELAAMLRPVVGNDVLVCDCSEPKSIQELKDEGINAIGARKGPDSVTFGIQWLQGNKIVIHKECQETINEFQLYQWKKDKYGETMPRPIDKYNHHLDCIRYSLEDDMEKAAIFIA